MIALTGSPRCSASISRAAAPTSVACHSPTRRVAASRESRLAAIAVLLPPRGGARRVALRVT
jgi:hypothetical protein